MLRLVNALSLIAVHRADPELEWMMFWLSSLPQFRQFRNFSVSTSGLSQEDNVLDIVNGRLQMSEDLQRRTRPIRYLPSYSSSYWMWYKGRYVTISRTKEGNRWNSDKSTLQITLVSSGYITVIAQSLKDLQNIFP
jgi:chaperone BCS1